MESKNEVYKKAKEKLEELKGFYRHLIIFLLVNALLILINFVHHEGGWWFYWPLIGWGTGVLFHAFQVYGFKFLGKNWESKKIKEIITSLDNENNNDYNKQEKKGREEKEEEKKEEVK